MSVSMIDTPDFPVPETKEEATHTISEMQDMETSYNSICNQALDTIEAFLSYPELDPSIRENLQTLLPRIAQQKDKLLALISQAQGTLEVHVDTGSDPNRKKEDDDDDDVGSMDSHTIAEYEQCLDEFTSSTVELNQQLAMLAKVVSPDR